MSLYSLFVSLIVLCLGTSSPQSLAHVDRQYSRNGPDLLSVTLCARELASVFNENPEPAPYPCNPAATERAAIGPGFAPDQLRRHLSLRHGVSAVAAAFLIAQIDTIRPNIHFVGPANWSALGTRIVTISAVLLVGVLLFLQIRYRLRAKANAFRLAKAAEIASVRDELEVVFNAATSGIVALDVHGRIVRINSQARELLGGVATDPPFAWPSDIQFFDRDAIAPLSHSDDPLRRALSGHSLRGETHLLGQAQTGKGQRYVRVKSTHLDDAEHGIAIVLIIDDVSNEERSRQAVERKSRLDALGQLTGGIAHDFNNVLASMMYAIGLAKTANSDEQRDKFLDIADSSIERGRELTARLLAFAKRQPGLASSKDIKVIFRDFDQFIRPMMEEKVALQFDEGTQGLYVFCDHTQLETALMNLVLNSRDAILDSGKGDRIDIKVRAVRSDSEELETRQKKGLDDDVVELPSGVSYRFTEILVSDNGPGMDAETLSRCTDPFFTTKSMNAGTGLGLSMVYGFVRQSDGELRIYSELGVGTTTQLILPRGTPQGDREAPVKDDQPVLGRGEAILVVEDEPHLLLLMSSVLEGLGYSVTTATSGDQALELIENGEVFDLCLTDVIMPGGIGGFELARRLKLVSPDLPVIYTSGYTGFTKSEMGDVQAPLLQKPTPTDELAGAIATALRGKPDR